MICDIILYFVNSDDSDVVCINNKLVILPPALDAQTDTVKSRDLSAMKKEETKYDEVVPKEVEVMMEILVSKNNDEHHVNPKLEKV